MVGWLVGVRFLVQCLLRKAHWDDGHEGAKVCAKCLLNLTKRVTRREGLTTSTALFILDEVLYVFDNGEQIPNGVPRT